MRRRHNVVAETPELRARRHFALRRNGGHTPINGQPRFSISADTFRVEVELSPFGGCVVALLRGIGQIVGMGVVYDARAAIPLILAWILESPDQIAPEDAWRLCQAGYELTELATNWRINRE